MRTYPQIKESLILENGVRYDKIVSLNNGAFVQFAALNQAIADRSDVTIVESMPDNIEVYGIILICRFGELWSDTNEYLHNASLHVSSECGRLGKWLVDFHIASNVNGVAMSNNGYTPGANPFLPGSELFNPYKSIGSVWFPGAAHGIGFDISAEAQATWASYHVVHETAPFVCGRQGVIFEEKEQVSFTFSQKKWPNAVVDTSPSTRFYAYLYGKVLK